MKTSMLVANVMAFNHDVVTEYATADNAFDLLSLEYNTHALKVGFAARLLDIVSRGNENGEVNDEDLLNAMKYLMVIILSQKEHLDWSKAYDDFNIEELRNKY